MCRLDLRGNVMPSRPFACSTHKGCPGGTDGDMLAPDFAYYMLSSEQRLLCRLHTISHVLSQGRLIQLGLVFCMISSNYGRLTPTTGSISFESYFPPVWIVCKPNVLIVSHLRFHRLVRWLTEESPTNFQHDPLPSRKTTSPSATK